MPFPRLRYLWHPLLLAVALTAGLFSAAAPAGASAPVDSTVAITFNVDASTAYGDTILVTGSSPRLGGWNPSAAIPLSTTATTYPRWTASVQLPAGSTLRYKYLRRAADGTVTWESTSDRTLTAPSTGPRTTGDRWSTDAGTGVDTTFRVSATALYRQSLYVIGDIPELGSWNPAEAVSLSAGRAYPTWSASIVLPPHRAIQYKYLKKNPDGTFTWEKGADHTALTSSDGVLTLDDHWQ